MNISDNCLPWLPEVSSVTVEENSRNILWSGKLRIISQERIGEELAIIIIYPTNCEWNNCFIKTIIKIQLAFKF